MGRLKEAIIALDMRKVMEATQDGLDAHTDPIELIEEARDALEHVGQEFERGTLFLMELTRAAQIFKKAAALINPEIRKIYKKNQSKGTVLLGSVAGDIHDLGKGIVAILLECAGFRVIDLGVDVSEKIFTEKIIEHNPQVVGLSGLLTTSIPIMKSTTNSIRDLDPKHKVKVIAGGGIVGDVDPSQIGADYATSNANAGVRIIEKWVKE